MKEEKYRSAQNSPLKQKNNRQNLNQQRSCNNLILPYIANRKDVQGRSKQKNIIRIGCVKSIGAFRAVIQQDSSKDKQNIINFKKMPPINHNNQQNNKPFKRIGKNKSVPAFLQTIESTNKLLMTSKSSQKNHEKGNFSSIPKQKMREQNQQTNKNRKIITSIHKNMAQPNILIQENQNKQLTSKINSQEQITDDKQQKKAQQTNQNMKQKINIGLRNYGANKIPQDVTQVSKNEVNYNNKLENQKKKPIIKSNLSKNTTNQQKDKSMNLQSIPQQTFLMNTIIFTKQFSLPQAKKDRLIESHGPKKVNIQQQHKIQEQGIHIFEPQNIKEFQNQAISDSQKRQLQKEPEEKKKLLKKQSLATRLQSTKQKLQHKQQHPLSKIKNINENENDKVKLQVNNLILDEQRKEN